MMEMRLACQRGADLSPQATTPLCWHSGGRPHYGTRRARAPRKRLRYGLLVGDIYQGQNLIAWPISVGTAEVASRFSQIRLARRPSQTKSFINRSGPSSDKAKNILAVPKQEEVKAGAERGQTVPPGRHSASSSISSSASEYGKVDHGALAATEFSSKQSSRLSKT